MHRQNSWTWPLQTLPVHKSHDVEGTGQHCV